MKINKAFLISGMFLWLPLLGCAPNLVVVKKTSDIKREIPETYPSLPSTLEAEESPDETLAELDEENTGGTTEREEDKGFESKKMEKEPQPTLGKSKVKEASNVKWEVFFTDDNLKSYIRVALKNNQEINILSQEMNIAKNEMLAREGEYLPKIGLGGEAEVEKVGELTHRGATDSTTEYEPGKFVPEELKNYSVGLMFSWELDIWKKMRNATKAALYRYLASVDGKNFMVTQLVSEISRTYYELMAFDRQLEIVEENIKIQTEALELIKLQKEAARVTSLAVNRFKAEVLKNRSLRYELRQKIVQTENKLNLLLGRYPQPIKRNSTEFLKLIPVAVNTGVPSDLLTRRPDVRQAENELKAADLDIKVARARFYPSLSIEAGVGYESFKSEHLIEPQSLFYNALGNLTAPLVNRKSIRADYKSANAVQIQAIFDYEKTLVNAYTEVANQLSKLKNLGITFDLKESQVKVLEESIEISNVLFRAARADYVEVLMTRRDSLEAQMELVEIKANQLNSLVNLYQALGGGWENKPQEI